VHHPDDQWRSKFGAGPCAKIPKGPLVLLDDPLYNLDYWPHCTAVGRGDNKMTYVYLWILCQGGLLVSPRV